MKKQQKKKITLAQMLRNIKKLSNKEKTKLMIRDLKKRRKKCKVKKNKK